MTSNTSEPENLDPELLDVDPLEEKYRKSMTPVQAIRQSLEEHHTALLVIDLQYLDAARGYGVFSHLPIEKAPGEPEEYYFETLQNRVLPNVARLQDTFRANNLEVIHTRIQSMTLDGRDRSPGHRRLGLHAWPGSKEAEILPEVAPKGDEIVINKTASGVFNATNIEYILRNMNVTGLYVCGVYTNECVSTTVRDASDRGFYTTLIDDACTTVTPDLHTATISTVKDRYSRVLSTDEAIKEINKVVA